jgi:hypothetical protein
MWSMILTPEDITAFQDAWQRSFGESLSFEEARDQAQKLLDLVHTLAANRNAGLGSDRPTSSLSP